MNTDAPQFILIDKPSGWTSFDVVNVIRKKYRQSHCHPFGSLRAGSELTQSVIPAPDRSRGQAPAGIHFPVSGSLASNCHPERSEGSLALAGRSAAKPCHPERSEGSCVPNNKDSSVVALPQNDNPKPTKLRVGHAGTLDPFATGLLIVGIGREATKRLDEFKQLPKTYLATIRLGAVSDTDDPTGVITPFSVILSKAKDLSRQHTVIPSTRFASINSAEGCRRDSSPPTGDLPKGDNCHCEELPQGVTPARLWREAIPSKEKIKKILQTFTGEQKQTPPMYSAKKINGQRLYKLARAGKTVDRLAEDITIHEINFLDYNWPDLKIEVLCSAGTYIRTLARDIGDALGTGAYCADLRRTKIGEYDVKDAVLATNY
jgi:tRNA U55 pseudouridine synthase TruB